jgi:hypothetical protein
MENKFEFTLFKSQFAMDPIHRGPWEWEQIVKYFKTFKVGEFNKANEPHFNGMKFREGGRRNNEGVEYASILVLDYDDGMALEDAKQHFKKYQHLGYTSYNHLFDKHNDGNIVEKFRILLPLARPIEFDKWQQIRHNIVDWFAPGVDPSCIRPHQPFAIPMCRPNSPHEFWTNDGELLDISDWSVAKSSGSFFVQADATFKSDKKLKPDDILETKGGNIRVGDVTKRISGVRCPFHADKEPGEFINKSDKGNIYLHCHKCGTIFMEQEHDSFIEQLLSKSTKLEVKDVKDAQLKKDAQVDKPYSREKRQALLLKECLYFKGRVMLLYAFEGFGKSYYAFMVVSQTKRKVVFACSSNEQAQDQAKNFEDKGLAVQFIPGREYLLKTRFGIVPVYNAPQHPWDTDTLDKDKTLKVIIETLKCSEDRARQIWKDTEAPQPDFFEYDMIVTTIARTQVWGRQQKDNAFFDGQVVFSGDRQIVPPGTVIFFDDPDTQYFQEIHPWSQGYADATIDGKELMETIINGRRYFVRPNEYKLGWGLHFCNLVFTTTELITRHLIEKLYPGVFIPDLMPKNVMKAGDISLISSPLVREKNDGYLIVAAHRINLEIHKMEGCHDEFVEFEEDQKAVVYIANGGGRKNNLVSSKGKNDLHNFHTLVKISYPHPNTTLLFIDALGWENSDGNFVSQILALDSMHQAIGRNSGYRWSDKHEDRKSCVVLVEPQMMKAITEHCRYDVRVVDPDKIVGLNQQWNTVLECVCWFIRNDSRYIQSGVGMRRTAFWDDVKAVCGETRDEFKGITKRRILKMLRVRYNNLASKKLKNHYQKMMDYLA